MTSNTSSRSINKKYEISSGPVRVITTKAITSPEFTFSRFKKMKAAKDKKIEAIGDFSRVRVFTTIPNMKNRINKILYLFF